MHVNHRLLSAALSVCVPAAAVHAASSETDRRRVLAIQNEQTVRIPATRARLAATIEVEGTTPAEALDPARQRSQAVLEYLKRSNVERLQAGAVALHPVYRAHPPDPRRGPADESVEVAAYRAQWTATFEFEAARVGEIVDGLVQAGVARIGRFEFTATDQALATARQQAVRRAALEAREDGHAILEALGYRPGDIVRVEVNPVGPIQPLVMHREAAAAFSARDDGRTAVEPGLIAVHGSVTVEIAY